MDVWTWCETILLASFHLARMFVCLDGVVEGTLSLPKRLLCSFEMALGRMRWDAAGALGELYLLHGKTVQ